MMEKSKQTVWRESASLILISSNYNHKDAGTTIGTVASQYDYKLLFLKRSDKTAMVTNQCVFPGGLFESDDESMDWLNYFREFGVTETSLEALIIMSEERPRIFAPQGTGCYDRFFKKNKIWAREISLRITALRETFEEVGILLCLNSTQFHTGNAGYATFKDDFDKERWQHIVHNDPSTFLTLCQMLKVIPDLWSLHEWSAWASPAPVKKGNETAFFIAFLKEIPTLQLETTEVKECLWKTPPEFVNMFRNAQIWLMPPQFYELLRFCGMQAYDDLREFSKQRSKKGVTLYLPVGYICTDGMTTTYPGDDFYLTDPRSATNFETVSMTKAEFRAKAKNVHRLENIGMPEMKVYLNFNSPSGQLSPVNAWHDLSKL